MRTRPAPTYLLPPSSAVSPDHWRLADGQELPPRLDHWDPNTDTEVSRTVEVDLDLVRSTCALHEDATFSLVPSWWSNRTRIGGRGGVVELGLNQGTVRASVMMSVPGVAVGGRLDLRTMLVLRSPGAGPSAVSPRREGAILWSDETRVSLEGAAARFPVAAVDFAEIRRLPDTAGWALEWDPDDLEAPILASVRLLINVTDEALIGALRTGSSDTRSALLRSFIGYDVARSLVHAALRSERFVSDPEVFESESVGRMLFELLALCWPGVPVKSLAVRLRDDPARIDAELQAHLDVIP